MMPLAAQRYRWWHFADLFCILDPAGIVNARGPSILTSPYNPSFMLVILPDC